MGRLRVAPRDIPATIHPPGRRCITFEIPDDDEWEQIAFSTLYDQLALVWTNWKRTGDTTGSDLCRAWRHWLSTWRHCSPMTPTPGGIEEDDPMAIRQNPDNPCILESSLNGTDWCEWADLSKCQNFGAPPPAGSPGPQPGGGSKQYCGLLQANSAYLVPTPLQTGDVISVTVSGGGNDGVETPWRCGDGSLYTSQGCSDGTILVGTDPLPASPHMSLMLLLNGTFYPFFPGGTITVGAGISEPYPVIQVNDTNFAGNFGSYNVCVTVTNNAPLTWHHTLDFTLDPYGFQAWLVSGGGSVWSPGVGWIPDPSLNPALIEVEFLFSPSVNISNFHYYSHNQFGGGSTATSWNYNTSGVIPGCTDIPSPTGDFDQVATGALSTVSAIQYSLSGTAVGVIALKKLLIAGTGTDPWPTAPL